MKRPLPPLARAALLVCIGTLVGLRAPGREVAGALASAVVFLGLATGLARERRSAGAAMLWGSLALAGLALGAASAAAAASDCRATLADGARLRVSGVLESEPAEQGAPVMLRARRLTGRGVACRGRIRVALPRGAAALPAGARVLGHGRWFARPKPPGWPRRPERAGLLALDTLRLDTAAAGAWSHPLLRLRGAAQRRLRALLPRRAPVAEALLLARREGVDTETRQRFVRAGLAHTLAISGLHVGVVAAVLLGLGRVLRLAPGLAAAAAAAGTILYVGFLGAPYAASRAALQIVLLLAARLLQRPSDPLGLLSAAAMALLAMDPLSLLDPGFQLSFAGVVGIVTLRRPIMEALPARLPGAVREGLAASTAATALTGPIAALQFAQAAPVGIFAGIIAVPIVGFVVPALAVALLVAIPLPAAGHFQAGGGALGLAALDRVAGAAASVPLGHGAVSRDAALGWALATALGLALAASRRRRPLGRLRPAVRRVVAASLALSLGLAWPLAASLARGDTLEIDTIDVGQGDATAIRTPHGFWILVDAGPRSRSFDAGRARVVPFLRRQGAHQLALLILTHPDADHIGGAESVLRGVGAASVLEPAVPVARGPYAAALAVADSEGARWYRARAGETLAIDDVAIRVLAPRSDALMSPGDDANQYSVVIRVSYGRFAALFDGDAPTNVERDVARREHGRLHAQVLKVGHHGSATSSSEALLNAVHARVALISVGRHNRYGHPDAGVVERLRRHDMDIFRTDLQGTIRVRGWPDGRYVIVPARPLGILDTISLTRRRRGVR